MILVERKGNKVQVALPTGGALHAEDERPARIPTAYLAFPGDRPSPVTPEFGSRQCAHNELDRDMRD
jgi:hypothetical protein